MQLTSKFQGINAGKNLTVEVLCGLEHLQVFHSHSYDAITQGSTGGAGPRGSRRRGQAAALPGIRSGWGGTHRSSPRYWTES